MKIVNFLFNASAIWFIVTILAFLSVTILVELCGGDPISAGGVGECGPVADIVVGIGAIVSLYGFLLLLPAVGVMVVTGLIKAMINLLDK